MKRAILFVACCSSIACQGEFSQFDPDVESNTVSDSGTDTAQRVDMSSEDSAQNNGDDAGASDIGGDALADMPSGPVAQHVITAELDGTLSSFNYDPADGTFTRLDTDNSATRFSFAAFHPLRNDIVYTNSNSTVRAYSYDPNVGDLAFLAEGTVPDYGTHLEVDHTGALVISVSYGGGTISVVPLNAQGEPQNATMTLGTGDTAFCQNAHQVRIPPQNDFAYVPCLGNDHVQVLALDVAGNAISSVQTADVPAGAGPRHMDFHPTQPWVYVLNETASSISVFSRDANSGMLTGIETVSALPVGVTVGSASSDIHVSPDGRHVYAVNRQPRHEIAAFSVNVDGTLALVGHYGGMGDHSRSFALDAAGRYLLLGNRDTTDVVTFSRNVDTGVLNFVREDTNFPGEPMFVGFLNL